jgi:hypothetical protein
MGARERNGYPPKQTVNDSHTVRAARDVRATSLPEGPIHFQGMSREALAVAVLAAAHKDAIGTSQTSRRTRYG